MIPPDPLVRLDGERLDRGDPIRQEITDRKSDPLSRIMRGSLATCDCRDTREPWRPLGDGFPGKELATMVIVCDRETAEDTNASWY